jgi:hypothetical protein
MLALCAMDDRIDVENRDLSDGYADEITKSEQSTKSAWCDAGRTRREKQWGTKA